MRRDLREGILELYISMLIASTMLVGFQSLNKCRPKISQRLKNKLFAVLDK